MCSMGSMGSSESVVYIKIGKRCQFGSKLHVAFLLAGMEPKVLEHEDFALLQGLGHSSDI